MRKTAEEWRDIEGYEGIYQVSNMGRIKSLERKVNIGNGKQRKVRERIMRLKDNQKGYLHVDLSVNGCAKTYKVHRLVAIAFIDNPDNLAEVNHIDEIKSNNRADNLEWVTKIDNFYYGTGQARAVRNRKERGKIAVYQYDKSRKLIHKYDGATDCKLYGYSPKVVSRAVNSGKCYKGFYWSHNSQIQKTDPPAAATAKDPERNKN